MSLIFGLVFSALSLCCFFEALIAGICGEFLHAFTALILAGIVFCVGHYLLLIGG